MKTAVIYARYSSERQTEQSIEGQLRVCNDYAERNDIFIIRNYIDRAMTGTNDNREQFQQMLKDSDKKAWDYVLVYKLDRFSRNKYEMAMHRKRLKDNGIKILSAMENIPDSPEGILLESLLEGMNQYYSEELSQKVQRGLRETRIKGNVIGGRLNYGYYAKDKKVFINEDEAPVLQQIFHEYANGALIMDIIKNLHSKGITNRGKPFRETGIYYMLKQEKYTGVYTIHGQTYDNIFPKIISPEIFAIVRKRIDANKYGKHVSGISYLLLGKAVCAYCGRKLSSYTGTARTGKTYRYYRCKTLKQRDVCRLQSIDKTTLETVVSDAVTKSFSTEKNLAAIADRIVLRNDKSDESRNVLRMLERELRKTEKAIANMLAAIEQGVITDTTKSRLQELEKSKKEQEENIAIEKASEKPKLTKEQISKYIRYALSKAPKQMIDLLVERIDVANDKISITFKYTHDNRPDESRQVCSFMSYDFTYEKSKGGCKPTPVPKTITVELLI